MGPLRPLFAGSSRVGQDTPMQRIIASTLLAIALCACGNKSAPPSEPEPAPAPTTASEPGTAATPTTAEECTAAGHTVVGDIGDGKVKCPDGTTEISRISYGIEG